MVAVLNAFDMRRHLCYLNSLVEAVLDTFDIYSLWFFLGIHCYVLFQLGCTIWSLLRCNGVKIRIGGMDCVTSLTYDRMDCIHKINKEHWLCRLLLICIIMILFSFTKYTGSNASSLV